MPSSAFHELMKTLQNEINHCLEKGVWLDDTSSRLVQAMRYSLLAPGKRIRPILVLLTAEAVGEKRTVAMPAALAIEMIHTYSLIHDDLPAMDDDDLRRGRPTCHKAFDEATAILAGNALLTLAFEVLATGIADPHLACRSAGTLAHAAGYAGMVGGQMDDMQQAGQATGTLHHLQHIHSRKTGALLRAAVSLGAILGQTDAATTAALHSYAEQLGLAFQIADDLLDVQSNAGALGKNTNKDAAKGKLTYPGLLGVEGAKQELQTAHQRGLHALQPLGPAARHLADLLTYVVERDR